MVSYSTLLMNHLPVYLTIQFQEQFYTYVPPSAKKPENYIKTSTGQRITLSWGFFKITIKYLYGKDCFS